MNPHQKNKNDAIVLFDSICNFCSRSVLFIIKRDPAGYFRFAALQTESGSVIAEKYRLDLVKTDSIILIENERVFYRSDAALRISRRLSGAWKLFYAFIIVPSFIRNFIYDFVARNRYKWFGRRDYCFIPDETIKPRFLL